MLPAPGAAVRPRGPRRRRPHLAAQVARRAPHVVADLGGQLGDRVADLQLQVGQFAAAVGQFGAARVGDRVDLAAALGGVADQALGLQLGQPRVDGAGGGRVQALEALLQQPDHLVAVARRLVQQLQQVEAQAAVGEDGRHVRAPSCRSGVGGGVPGLSSDGPVPVRCSRFGVPWLVLRGAGAAGRWSRRRWSPCSVPVPAPRRPVIFLAPHWPLTRRSSKALETVPLAVLASTSASAGCGSRMAISPGDAVQADVGWARPVRVEVEDHVAADRVGPHAGARALDDGQVAGDGVEAQVAGDGLGLHVAGDGVGAYRAGEADEGGVAGDALHPVAAVDPGDDRGGADHADLDARARRNARETTALRRQPLRSSHLRKPFQGRSS